MGFTDGERYVGLTTDVVRRFAQHRLRHADLCQVTFRRTAQTKQAATERRIIHVLEAGRVPLRNRAEMSVADGDRDLDAVVPPEEQIWWLQDGPRQRDTSVRVEDISLRRRYRGKMSSSWPEATGEAVVRVWCYVPWALPSPRSTELTFWSLTCLPSGSRGKMLARMNLNMQEVLGLFAVDGSLVAALQLAESPFEQALGARWRSKVEARGCEVDEFRYKAGGHDQFRLYADDEGSIMRLLDWQVARNAIRQLNLNLLRKGPCCWSRNHCFGLADAAYAAAG